MSTILLEVEDATALAFNAASEDERRKYQILLSLRLRELTSRSATALQQIMDKIGHEAEPRGLGPEHLGNLLSD